MVDCVVCEKEMGFTDRANAKGYAGKCIACTTIHQSNAAAKPEEDRQESDIASTALRAKIDTIMLTTESNPDLKITERLEIVTAECAFGMNVFRDFLTEVRNVIGGRSKAVQDTMRDARKTALFELKKEAFELGANAVVAVDLDYVELTASGNMVMLVASGTAVVIQSS